MRAARWLRALVVAVSGLLPRAIRSSVGLRVQVRQYSVADGLNEASMSVEGHQGLRKDPFLVIGVKSIASRNAHMRDAIRATWGNDTKLHTLGVKILFLGCAPDLTTLSPAYRRSVETAIAMEKSTYSDFLTHELGCQDSFFTLVDKISAFFTYAHAQFPSLAYAMVIDDDVFIRVDELVALLQSDAIPDTRFYGGNPAKAAKHPTRPIRRADSRYYLPEEQYPLTELPPFVLGAQYLLSRDLVGFIARNHADLRGLRGLDDATIALWMLALQVRPFHLPQFQILREHNCTEDLISYADLSPAAMYRLHDNLESHQPLCTGSDTGVWFKEYRTIEFRDEDEVDGGSSEDEQGGDVRFYWDLQLAEDSGSFEVVCAMSVANESVSFVYEPASGSYLTAFCDHFVPLVEAKLAVVVGRTFCAHHRRLLLKYIESQHLAKPTMRALLALVRHNLQRAAVDDYALGIVTTGVFRVRVLATNLDTSLRVVLENLLVASQLDKQVVIPEEDGRHTIDAVVIDAADVSHVAEMYRSSRTSILAIRDGSTQLTGDHYNSEHVIVLAPDKRQSHSIYLPEASAVFGGMVFHSPLQLLAPVKVSADTSGMERPICVVDGHRCGVHPQRRRILELLAAVGHTTEDACFDNQRDRSLTPVDDEIHRLRGCRFVIAFDDATDVPGRIGSGIVKAFLAGSVPVYLGHSTSTSWLFNSKSFVDCGQFQSIGDCALFIASMPTTQYEATRLQPPVVNTSAFIEVFSWHPDVADMAKHDKQLLMSQQLFTQP